MPGPSGFLITFGDPKAILFYMGLLPAFVDMATVASAEVGRMLVSEETLVRTLRQARARGLDLMLLPYIRLRRLDEGEWRGTLRPPPTASPK